VDNNGCIYYLFLKEKYMIPEIYNKHLPQYTVWRKNQTSDTHEWSKLYSEAFGRLNFSNVRVFKLQRTYSSDVKTLNTEFW
jgi:hypothetical protein